MKVTPIWQDDICKRVDLEVDSISILVLNKALKALAENEYANEYDRNTASYLCQKISKAFGEQKSEEYRKGYNEGYGKGYARGCEHERKFCKRHPERYVEMCKEQEFPRVTLDEMTFEDLRKK